jgi:hypothetical protein
MRETCSSGSVRGACGDGRPYRERICVAAGRVGQSRFTQRQRPLSLGTFPSCP